MTAAGVWTYTLNNTNLAVQALTAGKPRADRLVHGAYRGRDGAAVSITINGVNDTPSQRLWCWSPRRRTTSA